MKNSLLVAIISFILGGALVYFLIPKKEELPKASSGPSNSVEDPSTSPYLDSINVLALLKSKFGNMDKDANKMPAMSRKEKLGIVSFFINETKKILDTIPIDLARREINLFHSSPGLDGVRTIWIGVKDMLDILGIDASYGNPHGYDGFRFYLAKAIQAHDPRDNGKTTLVMVPTIKYLGTEYSTDVLSRTSSRAAADGTIYNKFDPCPPPPLNNDSCRGTLLSPH